MFADNAIEKRQMDQFIITDADFQRHFLSYVGLQYGPEALIPSFEGKIE